MSKLPKLIDKDGKPIPLYTGFDALNALNLIMSLNLDESDFVGSDDTEE